MRHGNKEIVLRSGLKRAYEREDLFLFATRSLRCCAQLVFRRVRACFAELSQWESACFQKSLIVRAKPPVV